jgi:hypothetical protein
MAIIIGIVAANSVRNGDRPHFLRGVFEVTRPLQVQSDPAAPWFGRPGLGTQYQLPMAVGDAISQGYLKRVGP